MSFSTYNDYPSYKFDVGSCCKYPGCEDERVYKVTGELHNFCLFHRQKASENQRRYAQNKRERKRLKKLAKALEIRSFYREKYAYMRPMSRPALYQSDYAFPTTDSSDLDFLNGFCNLPYSEEHLQNDAMLLSECLFSNQYV